MASDRARELLEHVATSPHLSHRGAERRYLNALRAVLDLIEPRYMITPGEIRQAITRELAAHVVEIHNRSLEVSDEQ